MHPWQCYARALPKRRASVEFSHLVGRFCSGDHAAWPDLQQESITKMIDAYLSAMAAIAALLLQMLAVLCALRAAPWQIGGRRGRWLEGIAVGLALVALYGLYFYFRYFFAGVFSAENMERHRVMYHLFGPYWWLTWMTILGLVLCPAVVAVGVFKRARYVVLVTALAGVACLVATLFPLWVLGREFW